jgi:hypothetical protein
VVGPEVDQPAVKKLAALRTRLARLRRRRRLLRWATGYAGLGLAVLTILALIFGADWLLEMSLSQRIVALVMALGVLGWAFRHYTLPWLGQREDVVDVALLVERHEQIDTDLVAALEFDSPAASGWGSAPLQQAVIDGAARVGQRLDISRELSLRQLARRAVLLALVAVIWGGVACWAPEIIAIFFRRLLLAPLHYPSRTRIEAVTVNDQPLDLADPGRVPIKIPYGTAVRFVVRCSGRERPSGNVELTAVSRGPRANVSLARELKTPGVYRGQLERLLESVDYGVRVGDAWTEPGQLIVVAPPVVDLEMEVVPPSYTGTGGPVKVAAGLRQVPVIEGSQVDLRIYCDKRLQQATLTLDGHSFQLHRQEGGNVAGRADAWVLDTRGTPLAAVVEQLQYTIQVTDLDGLHLEQPLQGLIRIQPDQPPQISGSIISPMYLPTARPTIHFQASDDYGLARVVIIRQVIHADGRTSEDEIPIYKPASEQHLQRKLDDSYRLDLAPLKLTKGDQVKIVLQAVDFRGPRQGKAVLSEPLVFQVTDQQGILTMMRESDQKSSEQLKKMIQDQLGIGGSP